MHAPAARYIGEWSFSSCRALTTIDVPSVWDVAEMAFRDCRALRTVNLGDRKIARAVVDETAFHVDETAFHGCPAIRNVTCPPDVLTALLGDDQIGPVFATVRGGAPIVPGWTAHKGSNADRRRIERERSPFDVKVLLLALHRLRKPPDPPRESPPTPPREPLPRLPRELDPYIVKFALPRVYKYTRN